MQGCWAAGRSGEVGVGLEQWGAGVGGGLVFCLCLGWVWWDGLNEQAATSGAVP